MYTHLNAWPILRFFLNKIKLTDFSKKKKIRFFHKTDVYGRRFMPKRWLDRSIKESGFLLEQKKYMKFGPNTFVGILIVSFVLKNDEKIVMMKFHCVFFSRLVWILYKNGMFTWRPYIRTEYSIKFWYVIRCAHSWLFSLLLWLKRDLGFKVSEREKC